MKHTNSLPKLLSRTEFREGVFARDNHKCIICSQPATAAHHIIERRLWKAPSEAEGYFLNNGASLCDPCHIKAETTEISVTRILEILNVKRILPEHMYEDNEYDKWGNIILPNGQRTKGELFHDESVRKILKQGEKLGLFTDKVKYPRTYHLPFSDTVGKDDRVLRDLSAFQGKRVIITLKLDGENTTIGQTYMHARSVDGRSEHYQSRLRAEQGMISLNLQANHRLCGENMYAKHSIAYDNLASYFYVFSMWDESNNCLSWDDTVTLAACFEPYPLTLVPVIYDGIFDERLIRAIIKNLDTTKHEGFTIRLADSFHYSAFSKSIAKYVRPKHVHTHNHWSRSVIVPNQLAEEGAPVYGADVIEQVKLLLNK